MVEAVFAAALLLAFGTSFAALFLSRPHRSLARWQEECRAAVDKLERERTAWSAEMEATRESVNGILDSVERKRKQTQGQATRIAQAEGVEPNLDPTNKDHLRMAAGIR